ncbi:Uu.00g027840.m01.CDS01 [Anthostomella pinea]|uniref:Uu.00g027840.m01.CDS01 n=1 Tax=Anthostomella pinea TaxID=933095 RepID=A0AAI8V8T9_9PEZI|nr:Uu.00g027840.m01.CDS01 [Anthostomella pinea]
MKVIGSCEARDEDWLRQHQSSRQLPYELRVLNAKHAMLKDGIYVPNKFDSEPLCGPDEPRTPQQLFPENNAPSKASLASLNTDSFCSGSVQ